MKQAGKISTAFGRGGIGALVGALVGGCGAALLALFIAGSGALHWYRAQPPDWYIVTGFCAIVYVAVVVCIVAVICAVICWLDWHPRCFPVSGWQTKNNRLMRYRHQLAHPDKHHSLHSIRQRAVLVGWSHWISIRREWLCTKSRELCTSPA
jgi:hypothetical protein